MPCRRLNLQPLEALLQTPDIMTQRRVDVALRILPQEWIRRANGARQEIAWTLQTLSANALELSSLWILQQFQEKLLVETSSPTFLSKLPMDAMDFEVVQHDCHKRVKLSLWTHWLPKSAEVFRLIPPVCINADSEAYYRCIATLQGNQLRQLVQDSIDAYVRLFEQHQGVCGPPMQLVLCTCTRAQLQALSPARVLEYVLVQHVPNSLK